MRIIGLTGSIGSGKSTIRTLLQEKGARVIDADEIGHEVYSPDTKTWDDIVKSWGPQILDDEQKIDRKKLGSIVFSNPDELARLNEIVHPAIESEISTRLESLRQEKVQAVVLEAAILIEAGWQHLVDETWLVTANRSNVFKRLSENRGLTESQIEMRLSQQLPLEEKLKHSDVIIENNGDLMALRSTLDNLWAERFGSHKGPEIEKA